MANAPLPKPGPFDGLEARFLANADAIYDQYSTTDRGDGSYNDQPFLEYKPDDPNAEQVLNDNRIAPVGSVARDTLRISRFLASQEGKQFLIDDAQQQSGNTFFETRALNPQYITGNVPPYLHLERSLTDASQLVVMDATNTVSPASTSPFVGMSGRLQQETVSDVISTVTTNSGPGGLLGSMSPAGILQAVAGQFVINTGPEGPEGVNQRPEFNVNGQWFSILTWQAFQKQGTIVGNLSNAANALSVGNIPGAITNIVSGLVGATSSPNALSDISNVLTGNRGDPNNTTIDGSRYFITDPVNADRYLVDSMGFNYNANDDAVPSPQTSQLDRTPYVLPPAPAPAPLFANISPSVSVPGMGENPSPPQSIGDFINQQTQQNSFLNSNTANLLRSANPSISAQGLLGTVQSVLAATSTITNNFISPGTQPDDNPGEDSMLFGALSLDQRYNTTNPDPELAFIQQQLAAQLLVGENYWQANQPTMGFVGGITPTGAPVPIDPTNRTGTTRYFHDRLNDLGIIQEDSSANMISAATIQNIQQNFGVDFVNVFFFDYVNKKTIPFRAFVVNVQENITPEIVDTRYIGRVDRNIVYVGVTRELSFGLYIHAMNDDEMTNVWSKINYLTGLVFPAQYQQGFMVPPLVRLTIGDFYRDQPGYIRSLSHQLEQNTPWETTPGLQVPHGVLTTITFSVIERSQMQAGSNFYPFAQPRTTTSAGNNTLAGAIGLAGDNIG